MRAVYKKSKLSDEHKALLDFDTPGWRVATNDNRWLASLEECVSLYKSIGRVPKPVESRWLKRQKEYKYEGVLSLEREKLLDARLPGWSSELRRSSSNALEDCVKQARSLGRLPIGAENEWLHKQKTKHKLGKLSKELIKQLDDRLPGWQSDVRELAWRSKLAELVTQSKELGRLPTRSENHWLQIQKQRCRSGKLPVKYLELLDEALPGWRDAFQ